MNRLCMGCMREYDDRFNVCPHCGYEFNTPPKQSYHIPPGSVLQQRYIVGRALGFGGFGITYIGWDYVMARKVAIKEYLPSEFATRMPTQLKVTVYSGEREEQYKEGLIKTMEEARRLAKFESVPGIVQIYDCFEENGTSYIVMEFLEGMSLKDYLAEKGNMTPEQALPVVLQIAAAMEAVHKTGILHRDIAPDNIYVLNPDEPDSLRVKLLDFGAARYATTKHSKSLSVIIKPGYAPEEQYRSRGDQGTWTDVYALAATFYKMLTGVTPEDAMERSVKDEVKKPSRMGIKISKPTETALMNAMHVKIQDRTQTMEEFSQELMAAEVKERAVTKDKQAVASIPKWFLAVAGVTLAVGAAAAVLMMTGVIKFRINSGASHLEKNMVRVPNVVNQDADVAETV
ncbi:MAG: serine/threonine protein kinase, partial [Lachnospiraceae bacterium]|nr:serine/threonine protein kinase [Lachnospiraceae bacterium]